MTDPDLIFKKLAFIETCVADLRRLARTELLREDIKEERFVVHTLQLAIQATLDVASHIVSSDRLGEPATNRAVFDALARAKWISAEQITTLYNMSGFRNLVVHAYQAVDLEIVEDILDNKLDDLLSFCVAVRQRLGSVNDGSTTN